MTRLALPESGLTAAVIHPDNPGSASTGEVNRTYEQNKRLNGTSPLPALLVGTDPAKTAIPRSPVAMTVDLTADLGGTDDFVPFALGSRAMGGGWDTSGGVSEGWIFGLNVFTTTGTDSGDGDGLEHLVNLIETAHRSDVTIADVVGLSTQAAFAGASADDGVAGTITSMKVLAPTRKDGNTGGTATNVYGLYIDPVDPSDLGGSFGYSLYIAGGGGGYITGSLGIGTDLGLPDSSTIYHGDHQTTVDAPGVQYHNAPVRVPEIKFDPSNALRIVPNNGAPNGTVYAGLGSLCLNYANGHVYAKTGDDGGNTGWVDIT